MVALWLCASAVPASAQVAFDSFGFQDNGGLDRASFNATPLTVGTGTQRVLECAALIGGAGRNVTNVAMKWGGTPMAPLTSIANTGGVKAWAGLFGLVNPASGKLTLSTTWSGASGITVSCWSLTGANQGGGSATFQNVAATKGQTATASVTLPSATSNFVIGAITTDANAPINSISGLQDFIDNNSTGAAGSHTPGSSSVTTTAALGSGYGYTWAAVSSDVAPGTPIPPAAPVVSGLSPSSGPISGATPVTIAGSGFTGATAVTFGSVLAQFTVSSDTAISTTSPAEAAGTVDVTVTTANGTSQVVAADKFSYTAPQQPAVSGVSPSNGTTAGGTSVTVSGSGFTGATAVNFGMVPAASFTVSSDTSISAVVPAESAATVDVTVTTANGTSTTGSPDQYTFVTPNGLIPPTATRPSYNTGNGFFVVGRGIYDANGNLFTPIGANRQHYDASEDSRFMAKPNVERLVPFFNQPWATNQAFLNDDVTNKVVPIPGVFYTNYNTGTQTTGSTKLSDLNTAVGFWTSQAADWTTYNNIAMFNIANEWGPCSDDPNASDYVNGYLSAIPTMRSAGYTAPLVVDAGCSGQGFDELMSYAQQIEDADPLHSIVFSIHNYGEFYVTNPICNGCGWQWGPAVAQLASLSVPVIFGEFGCGTPCGDSNSTPVTPDILMQTLQTYQMGWLAWSWDDGGCQFNLLGPCPNNGTWLYSNLTPYGTDVITSPGFGMQAVSRPATVFPQ
jgi:hypothetical protein